MTTGLTPTGFVIPTVEQLKADVDASLRANIDTTLDTSAESVIGNITAVFVTKLRELWELGLATYTARDPRAATFSALDAVCAFTGTVRKAASNGHVTLRVTLAAGATLPAGSIARVLNQSNNRWQTTESVTNSGGSPAGFDVDAACTQTGRIVANAGTITVIATPVTGWTAVTNALDASVGDDAEGDPSLRLRRELELSREGTATVPAIEADLSGVVDATGTSVVASVLVEENASAFYDAFHRPPNSIEAIVQFTPGLSGTPLANARQALANQMWHSVGGGITTVGDHSATVQNTNGETETMRWTEPTLVNIYVTTILRVNASQYVGDDAVKAAILAFGDTLKMGDDVLYARLICVLVDLGGVLDVASLTIGRSAGAQTAANVPIDRRELAVFDTSRITVTAE